MARKHEFIKLKDEEEEKLKALLSKGKHSSQKLRRARILLMNHRRQTSTQIIESENCARPTYYNVIRRYKEEGLDAALHD